MSYKVSDKFFLTKEECAELQTRLEQHYLSSRKIESWYAVRDYLLIYMIYASGCRANEALCVEWKDIDFESGTILFKSSKGGLERRLPFVKTYMERLKEFWNVGRNKLTTSGVQRRYPHRLFPICLSQLRNIWKRFRPRPTGEGAHLHTLRHTHLLRVASSMKKETPFHQVLSMVMFVGGHKTPTSAMVYLNHVDRSKMSTGALFFEETVAKANGS